MRNKNIFEPKNLNFSGSSILKNFSWPLRTKKRPRSGSAGSWDLNNKKKNVSSTQHKKFGGNLGKRVTRHRKGVTRHRKKVTRRRKGVTRHRKKVTRKRKRN